MPIYTPRPDGHQQNSAAETPPPPPPAYRRIGGRDKSIIGAAALGLIALAVAILTLPPPDAGVVFDAPVVVAGGASIPPVRIPVASDSGARDSVATPPRDSVVVAAKNATPKTVPSKAAPLKPPVTRSTATKPAVSKPAAGTAVAKVEAPAKNTKRRVSVCDEQVSAQRWDSAFAACNSEAQQKSNAVAKRQLATLYQQGKGVGRNDEAAAQWFTTAANDGDVEAMYQLAICYERGRGLKKDQKTALRWYTSAGDGGHPAAQYAVAEAFEKGRLGASKDKAAALEWYRKAAAAQYRDAESKVRNLSK